MTPARLSTERRWQLALALLYVVYYAWLLLAGHGTPYVTDANESFSVYWHSFNLFHFNFADSLGITDESFSPNPAAHPYLYTHQGNFPRLFAFLIYVLGARTAESQIAVTTAVVGTAALVLAYRYFARLAGAGFAAVYCALLMTDYVLYAQWHAVTDRVWYGLFVFALFACLEDVGGGVRRNRNLAFLFLLGLAVFYSELAFAGMLSLAGTLYLALTQRKRLASALGAILSYGAGGLAALAILFVQLSARFGTDVALKDLHYTFAARNFAGSAAGREAVGSFFEVHHIAFWPQYVNGELYSNLKEFIFSLSHYDLQLYTPVFCLATALLLLGWGLGAGGAGRTAGEPPGAHKQATPAHERSAGERATGLILMAQLAAALFLVLQSILLGRGLFALYPPAAHDAALPVAHFILRALAAAGAAVLGAAAIVRFSTGSWWAATRMPPWSAVRLLALLGFCGAALTWQKLLYDGGTSAEFAAIWMLPLATPWTRGAARLAVVLALAVAIFFALGGGRRVGTHSTGASFGRVACFVIAGLVGYAAVYWLSPGIVLSGFQWRYAPFVVFFLAALPASAIHMLVRTAVLSRSSRRERPAGEAAAGIAAAVLVLAAVAYWANLQLGYVRLLPPDHARVFRLLAGAPFFGRSFVSNSYTAPLAAFSGEWAYADTVIGKDEITLTAEGYVLRRDMKTNLWFADRARNPAYAVPDYYACFMQQSLATAAARQLAQQHGWAAPGGCSTLPLVADAGRPDAILKNEVVARDTPERDYWAVVRLDFDYPPYVRALAAAVRQEADGRRVFTYRADAAQQQGKPLLPPVAELVAQPGGGSCQLETGRLVVLAKSADGAPLPLPADASGTFAVRYAPRTATKSGRPVLSRPWLVTAAAALPCPWPAVEYSFAKSEAPTTWLLDGWGDAEPWGTWTVGSVARLVPDIHTLPDKDLRLTIFARAFVAPAHPSVEASVEVNGTPVGNLSFVLGQPDRPRTITIPRAALERKMPPEIRFRIADPESPLALGISSDDRLLGLGLRQVRLEPGE